ncbi:hypothetical protein ACIQ34_09500 [Ureibacillus sp. NPDC094379]
MSSLNNGHTNVSFWMNIASNEKKSSYLLDFVIKNERKINQQQD